MEAEKGNFPHPQNAEVCFVWKPRSALFRMRAFLYAEIFFYGSREVHFSACVHFCMRRSCFRMRISCLRSACGYRVSACGKQLCMRRSCLRMLGNNSACGEATQYAEKQLNMRRARSACKELPSWSPEARYFQRSGIAAC